MTLTKVRSGSASRTLRNRKCLVLNKNWAPVSAISLEDAITKVFSTYDDGTPKARIIEPESYTAMTWDDWSKIRPTVDEDKIAGSNIFFRIPEIILLSRYEKLPKPKVNFSRRTLYKRDKLTCFIPETLILMADLSLKRICDIEVGDKVLDIFGNTEIVEYVHCRFAKKNEMVSIRHRCNGDNLVCTKNHKLIPFFKDGSFNKDGVCVKDMTLNSLLGEFIPKTNQEIKFVKILDFVKDMNFEFIKELDDRTIKHYSGNPVKPIIKFDKNLGKIFGYFLSEGCVNGNNLIFTLNSKELDYVKDIQFLLKSIFGLKSSYKITENKVNVTCCSSIISSFFSFYCGKLDKRISANYNNEFLEGILYGIMRGDASFNNDLSRCTLMMSREDLIRDVYLISLIVGLKPSLSKTGIRSDGRIYKSVHYNAGEYNKISKICEVKYIPYNKNGKIDRKNKDGYLISKIMDLKKSDYVGKVYDLQISGSHTYIANFTCVHNCQYCGVQPGSAECTIDHIIPRAQGGKTTWENTALACVDCNRKKADKTPEQAGMRLLKKPSKPQVGLFDFGAIKPIKSWNAFVSEAFWNVELENDNES